jgi:hypothetical protein
LKGTIRIETVSPFGAAPRDLREVYQTHSCRFDSSRLHRSVWGIVCATASAFSWEPPFRIGTSCIPSGGGSIGFPDEGCLFWEFIWTPPGREKCTWRAEQNSTVVGDDDVLPGEVAATPGTQSSATTRFSDSESPRKPTRRGTPPRRQLQALRPGSRAAAGAWAPAWGPSGRRTTRRRRGEAAEAGRRRRRSSGRRRRSIPATTRESLASSSSVPCLVFSTALQLRRPLMLQACRR